jgi:bacillopeptidase F
MAAGVISLAVTIGAPLATAAVTEADVLATSQESSSAVSYNGWMGVDDSSANGGSYRSNATAGSTVSFQFAGMNLTLLTRKGPDQGMANVSVDRKVVGKGVDLYAATVSSFAQTFDGLASGVHKVTVKVLGTKNAASTGTAVAFDGFTVDTTTTQESANTIGYNTWNGSTPTFASGGLDRQSSKAGASATFSFTGTGVDWITVSGRGWGQAQVSIDGIDMGIVDLYAPTKATWQTPKPYLGLATGSHTITITVLGSKNAASTGYTVVIDAFVVHT